MSVAKNTSCHLSGRAVATRRHVAVDAGMWRWTPAAEAAGPPPRVAQYFVDRREDEVRV
jgi:hypothetical protein